MRVKFYFIILLSRSVRKRGVMEERSEVEEMWIGKYKVN